MTSRRRLTLIGVVSALPMLAVPSVAGAALITAHVSLTSGAIHEDRIGTGALSSFVGPGFSLAMGHFYAPFLVFAPGATVSVHLEKFVENTMSVSYGGASVGGSTSVRYYLLTAQFEYTLTGAHPLPTVVPDYGETIDLPVTGFVTGRARFEYPERPGPRDFYDISFSGTIADTIAMRRHLHPLPYWEIARPFHVEIVTPEPATIGLVTVGAGLLAARRRSRRADRRPSGPRPT